LLPIELVVLSGIEGNYGSLALHNLLNLAKFIKGGLAFSFFNDFYIDCFYKASLPFDNFTSF